MTPPPNRLDLARAALRDNRPEQTETLCKAVLADEPGLPAALQLLAAALLMLDRPDEALDCATMARGVAGSVDLMTLTGRILAKLERYEEAAALQEAAFALAPVRPDVITNLGVSLFELDRFGPALELFRKAFRLAPRDARVVANLGNFLDFAGTLDLSLAAYEAAASLSPGDREIRCNHGMALLRAGRLAEGWPLFESRRRLRDPAEDAGVTRLPAPLDGLDLDGKRVLVFHEQGFGDSLQFLRYVPMLAARGAIVLVRMPPPLKRLAESVDGAAEVLTGYGVPPDLDFFCPLMSLPLCFGTELATIPASIPYLQPPTAALMRGGRRSRRCRIRASGSSGPARRVAGSIAGAACRSRPCARSSTGRPASSRSSSGSHRRNGLRPWVRRRSIRPWASWISPRPPG